MGGREVDGAPPDRYSELDLERGYQRPVRSRPEKMDVGEMERIAKLILDPSVDKMTEEEFVEELEERNLSDIADQLGVDQKDRIRRAIQELQQNDNQ